MYICCALVVGIKDSVSQNARCSSKKEIARSFTFAKNLIRIIQGVLGTGMRTEGRVVMYFFLQQQCRSLCGQQCRYKKIKTRTVSRNPKSNS